MKTALPPPCDPLYILSEEAIINGCQEAFHSPRKRIILPLHRTQDDPVQRMLNFLQPDTYIQPHQHAEEGASETIYLIQGRLVFIQFSPQGEILTHCLLHQSGHRLIDITPKIWHVFYALEKDTVVLEIKKGPYRPLTDKQFAPWAPSEDQPIEAKQYMNSIIKCLIR